MFIISYRTKSRLKKLGIALGIFALLAVVFLICWMVWLQRYVVYTREGVRFDFGRSTLGLSGEPALQKEKTPAETVAIDYVDATEDNGEPAETEKFAGYYVSTQMLLDDMEGVRKAIEALPAGSVIMLDVKSVYGNFYYSTSLNGAPKAEAMDIAAMDSLLSYLRGTDAYVIARLPAFCDLVFGESHTSSGLALESGVLWTDDNGCYWLNPNDETVLANLAQICRELTELGFDEVAFDHFYFPADGSIVYDSAISKADAVKNAAKQLAEAFSTGAFQVSFCAESADFPLPEGSRLYLENVAPEQAETMTAQLGTDALVFLTDSRDTRFDAASVIRPLENGD